MVKKIVIVGLVLLFLAGIGISFTAGSVYNQSQLNSFSQDELSSEVEFVLRDVRVDEENIWFDFDYTSLVQIQRGEIVPSYRIDSGFSTSYLVVEESLSIGVSIEQFQRCLGDVNETMSSCKTGFVRSFLVKEVGNQRDRAVRRISGWQTVPSHGFEREDFLDVVRNEDLNPSRVDSK